jgi:hypothetical protein
MITAHSFKYVLNIAITMTITEHSVKKQMNFLLQKKVGNGDKRWKEEEMLCSQAKLD